MKKADKERGEENLREIVMWIGARCAESAMAFLPHVQDAIESTDKTISFGLRVKSKMGDNGTIECELVPSAPKIPTPELEPFPFMLKKDQSGQLEFLFSGSKLEMEQEIEERTGVAKTDGYTPGDNAQASDAPAESPAPSIPTGGGEPATPVH